ncbi:MAG: C40 family peptidase [Woeseia sp.]
MTAMRQVGTPYRYGGADEDGFDCSGLVYYSYLQVGKNVPRTTRSLWNSLQRIPTSELRAGDVLFFRIEGKVSHVGMYLGSRRFVHAPQSGRHVSVARLDAPFYQQAFIGAGRP